MNALIEFAGKQFKIVEGDTIKVPYVDMKIGSKITFDKILYIDNGKDKKIGNPSVKGVTIDAKLESHGRERKVVVFKFKRRKGYQKKNTHRQDFSILKVGKLGGGTKPPAKKAVATKPPAKKAVAKPPVKKAVAKPPAKKKTQVQSKE